MTKKDKFLAGAQKLLERGNLEKAVAEFLKAAQEDPKDTRTWLKVAEVHVRRGARQEAVDVYLKTAELYTEQGFFQRAVAVYKNILKLQPGYVPAHFKLAEVFKQLGLLSDAMQQYDLAAQAYMRAGRTHDALKAMRQLVELNPDHPAGHIKLAETLVQAHQNDDAVGELRSALGLLKAAGKTDEYLRIGERLLTLAPDDHALGAELASLYLERNNARFALARLQPCFRAAPRDPAILGLLVRAFEQIGQISKTIAVAKELGRVYIEQGRTLEARDAWRKVLTFDPTDEEARAALVHLQAVPAAPARPPSVAPTASARTMNEAPFTPTPELELLPIETTPSPAITFSEMAIPQFLLPPPTTGAGKSPLPGLSASTTQERVAIATGDFSGLDDAGGSGLGIDAALLTPEPERPTERDAGAFAGDAHETATLGPDPAVAARDRAAEMARILEEVEVLAKYGLLDRASAHVQAALALDPADTTVRERLASLLLEAGRHADAATEYLRLADQVRAHNPAAALAYQRRALDVDPEPAPPDSAPLAITPEPEAARPAARLHAGESDGIEALDPELLEEMDEEEAAADDDDEPTAQTFRAPPPSEPLVAAPVGAQPLAAPTVEATGSIDIDLEPRELAFDRPERTFSEGFSGAALLADLEQVDFFIAQDMPEEAQTLLDDLGSRYPERPEIAERRQRVANAIATMEQGALPRAPIALDNAPPEPAPPPEPKSLSSVPAVPRAVVPAGGGDPSTHGDLGIAYKEMGLFDAAIKEFRVLAQDPKREVFALTMMGECYEAKGALADAVIQYKKALNRPTVTDPESTHLYYLLGAVFEALQDRKEALYFFEKVARRDPKFRDIQTRLQVVRTQSKPAAPVTEPADASDSDTFNNAFDALVGGQGRSGGSGGLGGVGGLK